MKDKATIMQSYSVGYWLPSKRLRNLVLWALAVNLNIIMFYSGSVSFNLLQGNHQVAFSVLCLLNMCLTIMLIDDKFKLYITNQSMMIFLALFLALIATLLIKSNPTALREMFLLLTVTLTVIVLKYNYLPALMKRIAVAHLLLTLTSMTVLFFVLTELVDYKAWNVLDLDFISSANPIYVKAVCCARDLYNPWYVLLLSETPGLRVGLGPEYERMMFTWTEPTGTPLYTIPMMLYLASVTSSIKRMFLLGMSVLLIYLTYSMSGILAVAALAIIFVTVRKFGVHSSLVIGAILLSALYLNLELFLSVLGGNKLSQYYFFRERIDLVGQFSFFGLPTGDELSKFGYGTTLVFVRYGLFGYLMYLGSYFYIFYDSLVRLKDYRFRDYPQNLIVFAVLLAALMSVRSNQIVLPLVLMLYFSALSLRPPFWKVDMNKNLRKVEA